MSFTRSMYDSCACNQSTQRSIAPMNYRLYEGPYENCNQCFSSCGPYNATNEASSVNRQCDKNGRGTQVEVESILTNRVKQSTDCTDVSCDQSCFNNLPKTYNKPNCKGNIQSEESRFTHPIDNYRGMSIDRFQYLPIDPQCNIYCNDSIDTRLLAKDTYKVIVPNIIDNDPYPKPKKYDSRKYEMNCTLLKKK